MLKVARKIFYGIENILFESLNYINDLPDKCFDVAISALSIHHLDNNDKEKLFDKLYCRLPQKGIFVNYDQFCADDEVINS